jgi:membrane-bound metal-dependent hydrolase YbcI (DUF457 family)
MPSFLVSHQAPALLIKVKYRSKIDGIAICIGSMIPDLNLFTGLLSRNFTHSLFGVILLTVPLTILLTILFDKYLASLIPSISMKKQFIFKPLRFFGLGRLRFLKNKKFNKRFFIIAFYSAFLGGVTHLLLDIPTHPNIELFYPIIVIQTPALIKNVIVDFGTINIFSLQIDFKFSLTRRLWDLFLIPISLYLMRYIKKHNSGKKPYQF